MDRNLKQQMLFEANRKSTGVGYLLWFFFGYLGAHRFYLRRPISGAAQLMLGLFGWMPLFIGWMVLGLWWVVDAFLIPEIARSENLKTIQELDEDFRHDERIEDARDYRDQGRPLPRYR